LVRVQTSVSCTVEALLVLVNSNTTVEDPGRKGFAWPGGKVIPRKVAVRLIPVTR
jgi:hypothetical protein